MPCLACHFPQGYLWDQYWAPNPRERLDICDSPPEQELASIPLTTSTSIPDLSAFDTDCPSAEASADFENMSQAISGIHSEISIYRARAQRLAAEMRDLRQQLEAYFQARNSRPIVYMPSAPILASLPPQQNVGETCPDKVQSSLHQGITNASYMERYTPDANKHMGAERPTYPGQHQCGIHQADMTVWDFQAPVQQQLPAKGMSGMAHQGQMQKSIPAIAISRQSSDNLTGPRERSDASSFFANLHSLHERTSGEEDVVLSEMADTRSTRIGKAAFRTTDSPAAADQIGEGMTLSQADRDFAEMLQRRHQEHYESIDELIWQQSRTIDQLKRELCEMRVSTSSPYQYQHADH